MFPRHLGYEFAILTATCIVAIFLFPVVWGPYTAIHGPVTALLSLRMKLRLWLGMALAALPWLESVFSNRFAASGGQRRIARLSQAISLQDAMVLRC
jgi:hypothetical protein